MVVVGLVWLIVSSSAFAQGGPPAPAPAPVPAADVRAEAQQHFQTGVQAYNVGDFDTAIAEWKEAYRLLHLPDFLFNIGQAYRGKRDHENALFFFNSYLRERPDAPNAAEVTALRDEEQKMLDEERTTAARAAAEQHERDDAARRAAAEAEAARRASSATAIDSGTGQPDASRGRGLRMAGLIAGGAGLLLAGTGVVFTMSASSTASDLEDAAERGDPWTDELADKESSGERKATLGAVLIGVGAAAVVGGSVSFFLGWRKGRERAPVALVAPTGTGVVALVRF
jgi:tetratricopeptide (TPR) repeat protein